MLNTLYVSSGIKAALLAVGVATSAPVSVPVPVPVQRSHVPVPVPVHAAPATQRAILLQMDHRLGVIERTQETMLRGYETGGIYR
ncbi:MAG: hypothetical protein ACYCS8_12260 [Acidithiobacillus sp.]